MTFRFTRERLYELKSVEISHSEVCKLELQGIWNFLMNSFKIVFYQNTIKLFLVNVLTQSQNLFMNVV